MNTKMDSISVGDIDMDAMENQGLLTYAPTMLLLDPDASHWLPPMSSYLEQKQLICLVTTHEIAHQWFGDTVTMRDWQQEFLNEGFARFLQAQGTDDLFPAWDMTGLTGKGTGESNGFFQFTYEVAMTKDLEGTATAIAYPMKADQTPAEAIQAVRSELHYLFYEKGACVNRMLYIFMGRDGWDRSMDKHLHTFPWSNPTVTDLMHSEAEAFAAAGGGDTMDAVYPWLTRSGFPVVTLSMNSTLTDGEGAGGE
jgi:aminopeptidase N